MARLNTANSQLNSGPRRRPALTERSDRSVLPSNDTSSSKKPVSSRRCTEIRADVPSRTKSLSRRQQVALSGEFDIFPDGDAMDENERKEQDYDSSSSPRKKSRTLKAAHNNSLLLRLPQRPRRRPTIKVETDDYEKENDLSEDASYEYTASMDVAPEVPTRQNIARTARSRPNNGPLTYQRAEPDQEEEEDTVEDDSFNSLDDFIVSDNEDISYHETPDSETEEEQTPPPLSPPKTTRKRLMRGRRPNPEAEIKKALDQPSQDLRLEPSLPEAIKTPSKPDAKPKGLFQKAFNLSTELSQLSLDGDNEPASQLETELFNSMPERESSPQRLQPTNISPKTPPSSPSRGGLRSPTKEKTRIPPTPYRESVDAFWSQEVTNDWIDQHSPRKEQFSGCSVIELLQEFDESDHEESSNTPPSAAVTDDSDSTMSHVPPKTPKTPSKTALKRAEAERKRELKARRMSFDEKKGSLAEDFLQVLDDAVSGGEVRRLAESSGGVRISWSKTLKTTAGRAHWKGQSVTTNEPVSLTSSSSFSSSSSTPSSPSKRTFSHHAMIELATHIIDTEDRLLNTLAHEYCHLANYMLSNVHNNPHGASFKQWGRRCSEALKDHPLYGCRVTVTTKHNYKIDYKYVWCCEKCSVTYGRHSKSIDTLRARCGVCRGVLVQVKPKPRNVSPKKNGGGAVAQMAGVDDVTRGMGQVSL